MFDPGFDITPVRDPMGFRYGAGVFGPEVENRRLDDIRKSLMNPSCDGPETVYSIAMDVGKMEHRKILEQMHQVDKNESLILIATGTSLYAVRGIFIHCPRSAAFRLRRSMRSGPGRPSSICRNMPMTIPAGASPCGLERERWSSCLQDGCTPPSTPAQIRMCRCPSGLGA